MHRAHPDPHRHPASAKRPTLHAHRHVGILIQHHTRQHIDGDLVRQSLEVLVQFIWCTAYKRTTGASDVRSEQATSHEHEHEHEHERHVGHQHAPSGAPSYLPLGDVMEYVLGRVAARTP